MVLEVLADARQVMNNINPQGLQLLGITDPGQQQQLRRTERTGTENDLVPGMAHLLFALDFVLHTDGFLTLEDQAGDHGSSRHREVAAITR
ncbi:hypothetical protein FQZ97_1244320 [compost metagenome]